MDFHIFILSKMMYSKKEKGNLGENIAANYLIQNGYEILKRNWRYSYSEIDIIAQKDAMIIFLEVKTRQADSFTGDVPLVTRKQEYALWRGAEAYMMENEYAGEVRFDTIFILLQHDGSLSIEHLEDSFFPDWG